MYQKLQLDSMKMAMFERAKRASGPLDDGAKARLLGGYASSGSEREADNSPLSSLDVHEFFDLDEPSRANAPGNATDDDSDGVGIAHALETVRGLLDPYRKSDPLSLRLHADVAEAAGASAGLRWTGSGHRRAVMARLREMGHDAGICKARWESSGNLTSGNYEYIDVVVAGQDSKEERYIVDLDFAAQFEIARATAEYEGLAASLPSMMVGRGEEVRRVVRIMAEAARRSLKGKELSVPPWRKRRYMISKWFGPYRRTVNAMPSSAGATVAARGDVKCREVGFRSATQLLVSGTLN